jgi:hypothetical protein
VIAAAVKKLHQARSNGGERDPPSRNMARAISNFSSALTLDPGLVIATYCPGFAKTQVGDLLGGEADKARAVSPESSAVDEFRGYGLAL